MRYTHIRCRACRAAVALRDYQTFDCYATPQHSSRMCRPCYIEAMYRRTMPCPKCSPKLG